jgi:hypothetical protein
MAQRVLSNPVLLGLEQVLDRGLVALGLCPQVGQRVLGLEKDWVTVRERPVPEGRYLWEIELLVAWVASAHGFLSQDLQSGIELLRVLLLP